MPQGSVIREHRKLGPDVWCYRWWESGPSGNRVHRRIVLGTAEQCEILQPSDDGGIGAGNKRFRHSDDRKIHDTGRAGGDYLVPEHQGC